jgi:hypothetical protein
MGYLAVLANRDEDMKSTVLPNRSPTVTVLISRNSTQRPPPLCCSAIVGTITLVRINDQTINEVANSPCISPKCQSYLQPQ